MTAPDTPQLVLHDGQMGQLLFEVGGLRTQIAVVQTTQENIKTEISKIREPLNDHEQRLRTLEQAKPKTAWPQILAYLGVALPMYALVIDLISRAHG